MKNMRKVYNFNAGPAMLPEEVLQTAQAEMLDWDGTGMSIMELGHRGEHFKAVAEKTEADLRELMAIPKHYHVLFLAGGASTQFAMVPLNLLAPSMRADYIETGIWSKKAIAEASRYGDINVAATAKQENHLWYIPDQSEWKLNSEAAYLHYTPNETIAGLEFPFVPKAGSVPLVADMTSLILSQPVNVNDFAVIYAGAQKNLGQAGITIAIVRDDLIDHPLAHTPTLYQYKTHAQHRSLYSTPPTYSWYILGLVLAWTKSQGGVEALYKINQRKAAKVYHVIDSCKGFYRSEIRPDCRSLLNVMFYLQDEALTTLFLNEAKEMGLANLQGHRLSGGVRASMYNAMPEVAADKLATFMQDFAQRRG